MVKERFYQRRPLKGSESLDYAAVPAGAQITTTIKASSNHSNTKRWYRRRRTIVLLVLSFSFLSCYNKYAFVPADSFSKEEMKQEKEEEEESANGTMEYEYNKDIQTPPQTNISFPSRPERCTMDQLLQIRKQLPPELCLKSHMTNTPYMQQCSFTEATKCPEASWLIEYYQELHNHNNKNHTQHSLQPSSFLGISVGCNKGFDAINTLRMGVLESSIDKASWKKQMEIYGGPLHPAVCQQDSVESMFPIQVHHPPSSIATATATTTNMTTPEMHCIEPMPSTFYSLDMSSKQLGYDKLGLKVFHAAISKESGTMLFPSRMNHKSGVENKGLETCLRMRPDQQKENCEFVNVLSLRDYVDQNVVSDGPIHILSIDVEGFDGDVLLGASIEVLRRVEYLEFEYNAVGSWKNQHLYDIVEMLDQSAYFTCYWAGVDRLWRLTDCWMQYYDVHSWSNVACVNRSRVPSLASKMEHTFLRTLNDSKVWHWSRGPWHEIVEEAKSKYQGHDVLSETEESLRKKYISTKS